MVKDLRPSSQSSQTLRAVRPGQVQASAPVASPVATVDLPTIARLEQKIDRMTQVFGQLIAIVQHTGRPIERTATVGVDQQHLTKEGEPDQRFKENRVRAPGNERVIVGNANEGDDQENRGNLGTNDLIELNTATFRDLRRIPMMGESRAAGIIEFRTRLGGQFRNWDDLVNIPGISKGMLGNLQEFCTIAGQTIVDYISQENEKNQRVAAPKESAAPVNFTPMLEKMSHLLEGIVEHGNATPEEQKRIKAVLERVGTVGNGNNGGPTATATK